MNLQECKDQIAQQHDFDTWVEMDKAMDESRNLHHPLNDYERWQELHIKAMKLYACEKVKEVLQLAAGLSQEMIYDKGDCNMRPEGGLILRDYQVCYATPKQSILSLETEILTKINKEG